MRFPLNYFENIIVNKADTKKEFFFISSNKLNFPLRIFT